MRPAALLLVVSAAACGRGAAPGGGTDHLPTLGAGPYAKLADEDGLTDAEEPFVVAASDGHLSDPAALALDDGGYRIFFTYTPRAGGAPELRRVDLPALSEIASEPVPVLAGAAAPSAVRFGDVLCLFAEKDGDVISIVSYDDGETWSAPTTVVPGAARPGALVFRERWHLYFTRGDGAPGIFLATSPDGKTFEVLPDPVLLPSAAPGAFDEAWVGDPSPVGGLSPAGQLRMGLFYAGRTAGDEPESALGYAGSDDGRAFLRFANGDAILEPGLDDERAPSAVLFADGGVLFFTQRRAQLDAIAAAIHP